MAPTQDILIEPSSYMLPRLLGGREAPFTLRTIGRINRPSACTYSFPDIAITLSPAEFERVPVVRWFHVGDR